jgi:hypothetical protein
MARKRLRSDSPGILPSKHAGIEAKVRRLIEQERYVPTGHAKKRLDQREVTIKEVRSTLISGKRQLSLDEFHANDASGRPVNRWSYAFSKQGLDRKLRVCVAIDETREKSLLIVTVVEEDD